jgi:hypothetical protein
MITIAHQGTEYKVGSPADLLSVPTPALLATYNARTGRQTKKFSDRRTAEKQVARLLFDGDASTELKAAIEEAHTEKLQQVLRSSEEVPITEEIDPAAFNYTAARGDGKRMYKYINGELSFIPDYKGKLDKEIVICFKMALGGPSNLEPQPSQDKACRAYALQLLQRPEGATFEEIRIRVGRYQAERAKEKAEKKGAKLDPAYEPWLRGGFVTVAFLQELDRKVQKLVKEGVARKDIPGPKYGFRHGAYEGIRVLNLFRGWRLDTDENGRIRAFSR